MPKPGRSPFDGVGLKLEFTPFWNLLDDARRFVENVCLSSGVDATRSESVAMATYELLQNATTYSEDGKATLTLTIDRAKRHILLKVESRSATEHLNRLGAFAAKVMGEPDPLKCYVDMMHASVGRGGSGLGLARIRGEGMLQLDVRVSGNEVTICAEGEYEALSNSTTGEAE